MMSTDKFKCATLLLGIMKKTTMVKYCTLAALSLVPPPCTGPSSSYLFRIVLFRSDPPTDKRTETMLLLRNLVRAGALRNGGFRNRDPNTAP